MKKFITVLLSAMFAICLSLGIAACGKKKQVWYLSTNDAFTVDTETAEIPEEYKFSASKEEKGAYTISVVLEEGFKFTVKKQGGEEVYDFKALFTSRKELTEGINGMILVNVKGRYTITLKDGQLSYNYAPATILATGVELDNETLQIERNEQASLYATVLPVDAENKNLTWTSSNEEVATVSPTGLITGLTLGTTTITVTTVDGGFTDTCEVEVLRKVRSVNLLPSSIELVVGGTAREIGVDILPDNATNQGYNVSFNSDVARIEDDGRGTLTLYGIMVGSGDLTVTSEDGTQSGTCHIVVYGTGSPLAIMEPFVRMMIEDSYELTVSLDNAEIESIDWSVNSNTVATVEPKEGDVSTAVVTAMEFGTVRVTAEVTTKDGNILTATSQILVSDSYYFLYGEGLGNWDWDWQDYTQDRDKAEEDNVLFTEIRTGVYTITRHFDSGKMFQIIFPQVAAYTEYNEFTGENVWSKNIPSDVRGGGSYFGGYYDVNGQRVYSGIPISYSGASFTFSHGGTYKLTLDLTGSRYASVRVQVVEADVEHFTLELVEGSAVLNQEGFANIHIAIDPENVIFGVGELQILFNGETDSQYAYTVYNHALRRITVGLKEARPEELMKITLRVILFDSESSIDLFVLPLDMEATPVTSIAFEEEKYEFDVNNGMMKWTTSVKANVNADATNTQVRYYDVTNYNAARGKSGDGYYAVAKSHQAYVDPETGTITADTLGTYQVKAVAVDNPEIYTITNVLFYSSGWYVSMNWQQLDNNFTEVPAESYYNATVLSNLEIVYESNSLIRFNHVKGLPSSYEFLYLGMYTDWHDAGDTTYCLDFSGNVQLGWASGFRPMDDGSYSLQDIGKVGQAIGGQSFDIIGNASSMDLCYTIDLSGPHMRITIDDANYSRAFQNNFILFDRSNGTLKKGESIDILLDTIPYEEEMTEDDIKVVVRNDENAWIVTNLDVERRILTITATNASFTDDEQFTLAVTGYGLYRELNFTILAEHHLQLMYDDEAHWYGCTDEGCDYTEQWEVHEQQTVWSTTQFGHYYSCAGCGVQFLYADHTFEEPADGIYEMIAEPKCTVCRTPFFDVGYDRTNTFVFSGVHGHARTIRWLDGIQKIGANALQGHDELEEIIITNKQADTLTEIGSYAFDGTSLKTFRIGANLTTIGAYSFRNTPTVLTFSTAMQTDTTSKSIGMHAFENWTGGTTFNFPAFAGNKYVSVGSYAFAGSSIRNMNLPSSLAQGVFENCTSLEEVYLRGMSTLSSGFAGCTNLKRVLIDGSTFWSITGIAFQDCAKLQAIYVTRPMSEILKRVPEGIGKSQPSYAGGTTYDKWIKGKLYVYEETDLGPDIDYAANTGWVVGTWHWGDKTEQDGTTPARTFSNIVLWKDTVREIAFESFDAILPDTKYTF